MVGSMGPTIYVQWYYCQNVVLLLHQEDAPEPIWCRNWLMADIIGLIYLIWVHMNENADPTQAKLKDRRHPSGQEKFVTCCVESELINTHCKHQAYTLYSSI